MDIHSSMTAEHLSQFVVSDMHNKQFSFVCMWVGMCVWGCVYVLFYTGVIPTFAVKLPPARPEGRKHKELMLSPLVSVPLSVVPYTDNGSLLRLGAERVVFVLHWSSDERVDYCGGLMGARELYKEGMDWKSKKKKKPIGGLQEWRAQRRV